MLYDPPRNLPNLFFRQSPFFFSGLTAGPTYRPPVRHSNPDAPLMDLAFCGTTANAEEGIDRGGGTDDMVIS